MHYNLMIKNDLKDYNKEIVNHEGNNKKATWYDKSMMCACHDFDYILTKSNNLNDEKVFVESYKINKSILEFLHSNVGVFSFDEKEKLRRSINIINGKSKVLTDGVGELEADWEDFFYQYNSYLRCLKEFLILNRIKNMTWLYEQKEINIDSLKELIHYVRENLLEEEKVDNRKLQTLVSEARYDCLEIEGQRLSNYFDLLYTYAIRNVSMPNCNNKKIY